MGRECIQGQGQGKSQLKQETQLQLEVSRANAVDKQRMPQFAIYICRVYMCVYDRV